MRTFLLVSFSTIPLALTAAPVLAQPVAEGAPGVCDCPAAVPIAAPMPELPHWAIGLRLSSMSFSPKDTPDQHSEWGGGGLELRYRFAPHWEVALEAEAAREQLANGQQGDRVLQHTTLAARYHFRPYATWDVYALAGVGSAAMTTVDATDAPPADAHRATATVGVGLARRFGHIALAAELRAIGIAPADTASADASAKMAVTKSAGPTMPTPTPSPTDDRGSGGGSFSLTAAYEF